MLWFLRLYDVVEGFVSSVLLLSCKLFSIDVTFQFMCIGFCHLPVSCN